MSLIMLSSSNVIKLTQFDEVPCNYRYSKLYHWEVTYCYQSVNVIHIITLCLFQCDQIYRLSLYFNVKDSFKIKVITTDLKKMAKKLSGYQVEHHFKQHI